MLVRQQISNHPVLTDVERFVCIDGFEIKDSLKNLIIIYTVEYFKNGIDISDSFTKNVPIWIVNNSYKVKVLDENGEATLNPTWVPEYNIIEYDEDDQPVYGDEIINLEDEWISEYAFDYFKAIAFTSLTPIRIEDLMKAYILKDDLVKKRFNF